MLVEIIGKNPPGRRCSTAGDGSYNENVHVGIGIGQRPVGLVAGDVKRPTWLIDVNVHTIDGGSDFRGPFVHGGRGDRFLYLNWGTVAPDGAFELFRRAKLSLSAVDPDLVDLASTEGLPLSCTVNLTDENGQPRCARVHPPDIEWRIGSRKRTVNNKLDPASA